MTYYAVLDTNVLVSAMIYNDSVPGEIVNEALEGCIIPLITKKIIAEYNDVLYRPGFHFERRAVKLMIDTIVRRGIPFDIGPVRELLPDPKDAVFYQVVMEARDQEATSDSYLVTGNMKHFPQQPFIVTPREMLDIIKSGDI